MVANLVTVAGGFCHICLNFDGDGGQRCLSAVLFCAEGGSTDRWRGGGAE